MDWINWTDFATTLFASATGAGAAFMASRYAQRRREKFVEAKALEDLALDLSFKRALAKPPYTQWLWDPEETDRVYGSIMDARHKIRATRDHVRPNSATLDILTAMTTDINGYLEQHERASARGQDSILCAALIDLIEKLDAHVLKIARTALSKAEVPRPGQRALPATDQQLITD